MRCRAPVSMTGPRHFIHSGFAGAAFVFIFETPRRGRGANFIVQESTGSHTNPSDDGACLSVLGREPPACRCTPRPQSSGQPSLAGSSPASARIESKQAQAERLPRHRFCFSTSVSSWIPWSLATLTNGALCAPFVTNAKICSASSVVLRARAVSPDHS